LKTACIFGVLAITLALPCALCAENTSAFLDIIPTPREITATGEGFEPQTTKFIRVSDSPADRFAARLLRDAIRETDGMDCNILLLPPESTNWHRLWLGASDEQPATPPLPQDSAAEGYGLTVNSNGAVIAAASEAGLFYGAQTLIQLLEQAQRDKTALPGIVVKDWPEFGWRARYFDGSQYLGSIVMTRANLEREIQLLARYKLNWLCFESYNLVPFQSFPACANADTLSLADWNYLVELAHSYHVTLVPSLQSFGQMYQVIWQCDAGKPYREETASGLICPSRPENSRFLQGLYRDLISVFKYSPVLGIGCSEVGMQWQQKYCPLCRQRIERGETEHDIFCRHIADCVQAVTAAAHEAGRTVRPMIWADEFYMGYGGKRWEGIDTIPTNTIMGHWKYWKDYDTISGLLERGFDVFFLSATYQHNIYLVDLSPQEPVDGKWEALLDSGIRNVADQARQAAADTRLGLRGKILAAAAPRFRNMISVAGTRRGSLMFCRPNTPGLNLDRSTRN
jgi:hypothetical protein